MSFRSSLIFAMAFTLLALTGCGGGGGGGGASVEHCPAAPKPANAPAGSVTVTVCVNASDPDTKGSTLSYKWKSTDGDIIDINASSTSWTLPNGPGLHFAYVLVSNGMGGYTERRVAVNTDGFGTAIVVPAATAYEAPANADVSTGITYSGYVVGSYVGSTDLESDFRTFRPDTLVYLLDTVTNKTFPAANGVTKPVKTNSRGQFVIPNVEVNTDPANAATKPGFFNTNYTIRCSDDGGATYNDCDWIYSLPTYDYNESYSDVYLTNFTIDGRVRLADNSVCGVANDFFGQDITATAVLLDQSKTPIGNSNRLSHEGDFSLVQNTSAAYVRVTCENHSPIDIAINTIDPTVSKELGIVYVSDVKAPTVSNMKAELNNNQVGLFLPPPSGLPSDLVPGKEKFLAYRGLDTKKGACEYYKAIGAVKTCDADGNSTGDISFDDWKRATRMAPYIDQTKNIPEYTATYINQVDLNLTRNHHSISYAPNDTSAYVCNHLGPKDTSQTEINAAIENAIAGKNEVACVAMDHRVSPGVNGDLPYTRFLVFGPSGKLLKSINLDGRSEKFVPGTCVVCHGGDKYVGKFSEDGKGFADIGAHFLPYDIGNFAFSDAPGYTQADQEENIYNLNQNVKNSSVTPAGVELIDGWYANGHVMNIKYLPLSWQATGVTPEIQDAYHKLIAHSCRTCHVNLPEEYNFDHYTNIIDNVTNSTVCGTTANQWRAYSMPNSLVTFNRFWDSPEQRQAYETLMSACRLRKHGSLGGGGLAAGSAHTVNLSADGTLWARGSNDAGQLGINSTATSLATPVQIGTDSDWNTIVAGAKHTIGLKGIANAMYAWGDNTYGQLGDTTKVPKTSPVKVCDVSTLPCSSVNWNVVAAGRNHTIALDSTGHLWTWGDNTYGQLGVAATTTNLQVPTQIGTDTWQRIAAGAYHNLAIRSDGTLWAWGRNNAGQLGDGTTADKFALTQIGTNTTWQYIAAGATHSMGIRSPASSTNVDLTKTLWAWGDNSNGQYGIVGYASSTVPIEIDNSTNWDTVFAAENHNAGTRAASIRTIYGVLPSLGLFTFGNNASGQLGDGTTINSSAPINIGPNQFLNGFSYTQGYIGIGVSYTTALDDQGLLWSWGDNQSGQLGDGTTSAHHKPIQSLMAPVVKKDMLVKTTTANTLYQSYVSAININATYNTKAGALIITADILPSWLTLDTNTGLKDMALLTGTPSTAGTYPVVIRVSDGILETKYSFTITVN